LRFKSLTGIWAFIILTVGFLLKSLTGIWPFIMLTVGVLL
jgi:phage-related protein